MRFRLPYVTLARFYTEFYPIYPNGKKDKHERDC